MTVSERRECYLGDGVYVMFNGTDYCLRASRVGSDHFIFLDPSVLRAFRKYIRNQQQQGSDAVAAHPGKSNRAGKNSVRRARKSTGATARVGRRTGKGGKTRKLLKPMLRKKRAKPRAR